jgi:hypothetical protein
MTLKEEIEELLDCFDVEEFLTIPRDEDFQWIWDMHVQEEVTIEDKYRLEEILLNAI